jgi:PTH1 family peptidyl-tRNA hydrolase
LEPSSFARTIKRVTFFKRRPPVHHSVGYLVFGLGNPGAKYSGTRHNIGWWVLDELARRHKPLKTTSMHKSQVDFVSLLGPQEQLTAALVKPLTYMNLSGQSVREWLKAYPDAPFVVVYDEVDLPVGRLRLRAEGSAGGHNGMKSIIQSLGGRQDIPRLRLGVGRPSVGVETADHVLEPPSRKERDELSLAVSRAADVIETLIESGFDATQTRLGAMSNPQ